MGPLFEALLDYKTHVLPKYKNDKKSGYLLKDIVELRYSTHYIKTKKMIQDKLERVREIVLSGMYADELQESSTNYEFEEPLLECEAKDNSEELKEYGLEGVEIVCDDDSDDGIQIESDAKGNSAELKEYGLKRVGNVIDDDSDDKIPMENDTNPMPRLTIPFDPRSYLLSLLHIVFAMIV